jgi:putative Mg2+ transporter-C (MgtC) family protein
VQRELLRLCARRKWHIYELDSAPLDVERDQVGVTMTLSGAKIMDATDVLAGVSGVAAVLQAANERE